MAIDINQKDTESLIHSLKRYMDEELETELNNFQAKLFLDYILKEIGPFAYNEGVQDAERYFREKTEDLSGCCYQHGLTYWSKSNR